MKNVLSLKRIQHRVSSSCWRCCPSSTELSSYQCPISGHQCSFLPFPFFCLILVLSVLAGSNISTPKGQYLRVIFILFWWFFCHIVLDMFCFLHTQAYRYTHRERQGRETECLSDWFVVKQVQTMRDELWKERNMIKMGCRKEFKPLHFCLIHLFVDFYS